MFSIQQICCLRLLGLLWASLPRPLPFLSTYLSLSRRLTTRTHLYTATKYISLDSRSYADLVSFVPSASLFYAAAGCFNRSPRAFCHCKTLDLHSFFDFA